MEKVVYERMHVCMIMLKNMVWFKSMMLESRVTTPFGKDYGFICTCITGSTKFPNYNYPCEHVGE